MCWRAEELIAEVFGIEEGCAPNKTTSDALVEARRLRARIADLEEAARRVVVSGALLAGFHIVPTTAFAALVDVLSKASSDARGEEKSK